MGTSIGKAIDYLVANLATPLSVIDPLVEVADNLPTRDDGSWVVVGRAGVDQGDAASGTVEYAELGAQRIQEQYTLSGFVCVYRDGPKQKVARDAAIALYDGVVSFVHGDPTLGGLLTRGRIALVSRVVVDQTQDDQDSGTGRVITTMPFELEVHNSYIP